TAACRLPLAAARLWPRAAGPVDQQSSESGADAPQVFLAPPARPWRARSNATPGFARQRVVGADPRRGEKDGSLHSPHPLRSLRTAALRGSDRVTPARVSISPETATWWAALRLGVTSQGPQSNSAVSRVPPVAESACAHHCNATSRSLGNWPLCPTRHNTAAQPRRSACLSWGARCHLRRVRLSPNHSAAPAVDRAWSVRARGPTDSD